MNAEGAERKRELISRWDRAFHTVGCDSMEIVATPRWRIPPRTYSRQYQALSAESRRQIVAALLEAPPDRVSLPEAANPPYLGTDLESFYVELVHTHLPMLEECGFVTWDEEPPQVARGPAFEEVAIVFESLSDHVARIPDRLRVGCQRLEERTQRGDE